MEPFDYPDNDPGPQTLLTSLTPEQNLDRLHWLMSRFQGYVGLISYMGARLTASQQGLLSMFILLSNIRGQDLKICLHSLLNKILPELGASQR